MALEVTRAEEIYLAKKNGKLKQLYHRDIRKAIKKKKRMEDELAITRKMLKRVFELVVELHGSEVSDAVIEEFKEYFDSVEQIKIDLKEELGLNENTDI